MDKFINKLKNINSIQVLSSIDKVGAFYIPNFFSKAEIKVLMGDFEHLEKIDSRLNSNNSGLVYYNNQLFISQTLVHSLTVFKFLTDKKIYSIFKSLLGRCVIKASRFYSTYGSGISMWHHDEKNNGYHSRGVICIIYLSDVLNIEDGPFEFISGSHNFSINMNDDDFFENKIRRKYKQDIVSVIGKAGTILFADSRVIHRARPHNKKDCRKSLFIQISKQTKNMYKEQILINPEFITNKHFENKELMSYLGFGHKCEPHIFPPTSMSTLPLNRETVTIFSKWAGKRLSLYLFEKLPIFLKKYIRKFFGRPLDYDSIKYR